MGIKCLGLFLCVLLVTMAEPTAAKSAPDPALKAVSSGVNQFALSLLKAAIEAKGADQNVLVSPLSASLATAMLYQGAKGATKAELQSGLVYPTEDAQFERGVSLLNDNLNNTPNVTLEVANRVYLDKSFEGKLKSSYQDALTKVHKSSLVALDLQQAPEPSRAEINNWVSDKTHEKIKDLLPQGSIDGNTAMVLVNALYFKGKWKKQFEAKDTVTLPFHLTKDKQVNVSMMHRTASMQYAEVPELQAKVLALPYEGEKIKMVLVLPNEIDGLSGVLNKLTSGEFNLENVQFYYPEVSLWLPKFKIEDTHDLKAVYEKLNMGNMFSSAADFSGIVDPPPILSVSAAIQKTFMEVNEEGTTAAAATVVTLGNRVMVKPVNLTVNHPFVILIKMTSADGTSNSTLFAGAVTRPAPAAQQSESPKEGATSPVPIATPNVTDSSVSNENRNAAPEKAVAENTQSPAPEIIEKPVEAAVNQNPDKPNPKSTVGTQTAADTVTESSENSTSENNSIFNTSSSDSTVTDSSTTSSSI